MWTGSPVQHPTFGLATNAAMIKKGVAYTVQEDFKSADGKEIRKGQLVTVSFVYSTGDFDIRFEGCDVKVFQKDSDKLAAALVANPYSFALCRFDDTLPCTMQCVDVWIH